MTVTKVVVLVLRIPEHFSLHFSDFYTIFWAFLKFAVLKFKHNLQIDPWKFWFFSNEVPGGTSQNRGGLARRFPARRVTGGEGKVGENDEELESYLWVVVGGAEVVRSGGSTERGGQRRVWSPAAMF